MEQRVLTLSFEGKILREMSTLVITSKEENTIRIPQFKNVEIH